MSTHPTALPALRSRDRREPLDWFAANFPSTTVRDARQRLADLAAEVADHLGMPTRDVQVLAGALAVVGALFGSALVASADPAPGPLRQLEVQHLEWLAEQAQATGATTSVG